MNKASTVPLRPQVNTEFLAPAYACPRESALGSKVVATGGETAGLSISLDDAPIGAGALPNSPSVEAGAAKTDNSTCKGKSPISQEQAKCHAQSQGPSPLNGVAASSDVENISAVPGVPGDDLRPADQAEKGDDVVIDTVIPPRPILNTEFLAPANDRPREGAQGSKAAATKSGTTGLSVASDAHPSGANAVPTKSPLVEDEAAEKAKSKAKSTTSLEPTKVSRRIQARKEAALLEPPDENDPYVPWSAIEGVERRTKSTSKRSSGNAGGKSGGVRKEAEKPKTSSGIRYLRLGNRNKEAVCPTVDDYDDYGSYSGGPRAGGSAGNGRSSSSNADDSYPSGYVPFPTEIKRTDAAGNIIAYPSADPSEDRFPCTVEGCKYQAKTLNTLKLHMGNIHGMGVRWYHCDFPGCNYKAKQAVHVRKHQERNHDREAQYLYCDQPNCNFKAKDKRGVRQHKSDVHNIDVIWYHCDIPGCDFKAKQIGNLKKHRAAAGVHKIDGDGPVWYFCGVGDCTFKARKARLVSQHKAENHDIDVNWFVCDQPGCTFKTKQAGNLKRHKAAIHDIVSFFFFLTHEEIKLAFLV